MKKLAATFELMRLNKPIGIYLLMWPALIALVISTKGDFTLRNLLIVIVGSIVVRSAGCVINDLFDSDLDGSVQRTKKRPIPSKKLTLQEGWLVFIILGLISLILLALTNSKTMVIGIFFALMIVLYPLTKRFFIGPQLFLGLTFNPVIIVFAMTNQINNPTMLFLYFAITSMTVAYDSFYGLCDLVDDKKLGIKSTPLWWGSNTLKIIAAFQVITIGLLCALGWIDELNYFWFLGLSVLVGFFIYQYNLALKEKYFEAFKNNHWASLFILIISVLCYMI